MPTERTRTRGFPHITRMLLAMVLGFSALAGCAAGPPKQSATRRPPQAEARLDAHVRVEARHVFGQEMEESALVMNKDKDREARRQLVLQDVSQSGLFASVNAPGRPPDLVLMVETSESMPKGVWTSVFKIGVSVAVQTPGTGTTAHTYAREAMLEGFVTKQEVTDGFGQLLADVLRELYADYQAGKIRAVITASRAGQATQAQVQAARAAMATQDYRAALAAVRSALVADPTAPAPVAVAVDLLTILCDPEGAKTLAVAARTAHSTDARLPTAGAGAGITPDPFACQAQQLNREALALARSGQRAEALTKLAGARVLAPGLVPKASYNAAILLEQSGKPQEAVAAYLEAHRGFLSPADQREALTRLVACAQRANLPVPDAADRRYRLGIVRAQQKRYPEAVIEFEGALQDAPWLADAYYNLGLVAGFTEAHAKALQALRTYLTLAPQSPHASAVKTKIVELEDKLGTGGKL